VPHCGSVLPRGPICLSLRPVGSIHISCLAAREQTSAAQIANASPPYNMKYLYSFLALGLSFNSIFIFFTEAAQYECSYHRTAHHATGLVSVGQKSGATSRIVSYTTSLSPMIESVQLSCRPMNDWNSSSQTVFEQLWMGHQSIDLNEDGTNCTEVRTALLSISSQVHFPFQVHFYLFLCSTYDVSSCCVIAVIVLFCAFVRHAGGHSEALCCLFQLINDKLSTFKFKHRFHDIRVEVTSQNLWPRYDRHFVGMT